MLHLLQSNFGARVEVGFCMETFQGWRKTNRDHVEVIRKDQSSNVKGQVKVKVNVKFKMTTSGGGQYQHLLKNDVIFF